MKLSYLISVGRVCFLTIALGGFATPAGAQGICYMVTPEGQTINLESLCGQNDASVDGVDSANTAEPSAVSGSSAESGSPTYQYIIIEESDGARNRTVVGEDAAGRETTSSEDETVLDVDDIDVDATPEDETVLDIDDIDVEVTPLSEDEAEAVDPDSTEADDSNSEVILDPEVDDSEDASDEI